MARRFIYATGEATQLSTSLESKIGFLVASLTTAGQFVPSHQKRVPPVSATIKTCEGLLAKGALDLSEEELRWANHALLTASESLELRNRMVHDLWVGDINDQASITHVRRLPGGTFGPAISPTQSKKSDIKQFEATVLDLGRAIHMISALSELVALRSFNLPLPDQCTRNCIAILQGRFDLLGIHVAAPTDEPSDAESSQ